MGLKKLYWTEGEHQFLNWDVFHLDIIVVHNFAEQCTTLLFTLKLHNLDPTISMSVVLARSLFIHFSAGPL